MVIKPSTSLRNNYNGISALAKELKTPIYVTRNGEGDMVLMDIKAFEEREAVLDLREKLLIAEQNRLNGVATYSADEVEARIRGRLNAKA